MKIRCPVSTSSLTVSVLLLSPVWEEEGRGREGEGGKGRGEGRGKSSGKAGKG